MRRNRGGFTILEVMIFLVISGAMLAAAMVAVNGQQNRTEFTQAMRDIDSKLQDTLNDVSNGNFNFRNNQNCITVSGRPVLTAGTGQIGSRSDCLFLGEALQFGTTGASGVPSVNNNTRFAQYTVLGQRLKTSPTGTLVSVNSFNEANPTAMVGGVGGSQDLTSYYDFRQGITASHIYYTPAGGGSPIDGDYTLLGLYTSFTSAAGSVGNNAADAAQSLQAYVYKLKDGTAYGSIVNPGAKNCIDTNKLSSPSCPFDQNLSTSGSKGLGICFNSNNGTGQTALITIYNTTQGVSTRLEFNPAGSPPC